MGKGWVSEIPVLSDFKKVVDFSAYKSLPDDWHVGISDVVGSKAAIDSGRYKDVNLAGAATISAVTNALKGNPPLFAFSGDGAHFAVPPEDAMEAAKALSSVANWTESNLDLKLRVGMATAAQIRGAGGDVAVAFWSASNNVRYTLFARGGLEWMDHQLKAGALDLPHVDPNTQPDLTGLSCQWGPIRSKQGRIISLIVKKAAGTSDSSFADRVLEIIKTLEEIAAGNPIPVAGPSVRWPSQSLDLQSRVEHVRRSPHLARMIVLVRTAISWGLFKVGLKLGRFDPAQYRREITENTDFRKFDDGLMTTLDCSEDGIKKLRTILDEAADKGVIRYGLHEQEEALLTCVVPSILKSDHMHFIDGSQGGYAAASQMLKGR